MVPVISKSLALPSKIVNALNNSVPASVLNATISRDAFVIALISPCDTPLALSSPVICWIAVLNLGPASPIDCNNSCIEPLSVIESLPAFLISSIDLPSIVVDFSCISNRLAERFACKPSLRF